MDMYNSVVTARVEGSIRELKDNGKKYNKDIIKKSFKSIRNTHPILSSNSFLRIYPKDIKKNIVEAYTNALLFIIKKKSHA